MFAVSASLAFLLVELLYFFIDMNKKRKTKKAQTLKLEKQKNDFLESYNRYKPFIDPNSRVILKELSIKPYPIETDNAGLRNLLEHRFIEQLENVGFMMAFFKLNPIIHNQVVSDWESEIQNELQKFESKFKNFNEVLNCMRSDLKDAPTLDSEIYDRFNSISNCNLLKSRGSSPIQCEFYFPNEFTREVIEGIKGSNYVTSRKIYSTLI